MADNKTNGKQEEKKKLAETYGLDMEDIQHVKLANGKEFFQIRNPKDDSYKLISLLDTGFNAKDSLSAAQKNLSFAQGSNGRENARNILEHDLKYKHNEVPLMTLREFKNNKFKVKRMLRYLDTITKCKVKALMKGSKKGGLKFKYISIEHAVAIDEYGNIIEPIYDYATNTATLRGAQILNTEDKKFDFDKNVDEIRLSDEELSGILSCITITDDGPVLTSDKTLQIKGEPISTKTVVELYSMPEVVDKMNISSTQKSIYTMIIGMIKRRIGAIQNKQNGEQKSHQKQFVKTNNVKPNSGTTENAA